MCLCEFSCYVIDPLKIMECIINLYVIFAWIHENLLCIITTLVYVLPKETLFNFFLHHVSLNIVFAH